MCVCAFLCRNSLSKRQACDERGRDRVSIVDDWSNKFAPCRSPGDDATREPTQLTGYETLTFLLQLNRLIRRFRLEDAYLAQVIDVNAVLRQRVGHFLEAASTRSRDAPRSASAGDSDWAARISPCLAAFSILSRITIDPPLHSARRVEYVVKFAAFDGGRGKKWSEMRTCWRLARLSRSLDERERACPLIATLSTLLARARRHVVPTQTRNLSIRNVQLDVEEDRYARPPPPPPVLAPSRGVASVTRLGNRHRQVRSPEPRYVGRAQDGN